MVGISFWTRRRDVFPLGPAEARRGVGPAAAAVRSHALPAAAFCAVAGLWLLTHIYQGVLLDSRVYLGRAMADLAPATIGQDLMFVHDGQAGFSVFTLLARILTASFGPQRAATLLALAGTGLWFAAATAFVTRIAKGRLPWAILACLAVLPSTYGGLTIIPFGEALATPRPFAEAGVLAALAFVLEDRRWAGLACLIAAGLFHPIMALCGVGVVFIVFGCEDRRWIAPAVGLVVLTLISGALGLPVAGRLFQRIDPDWLALLRRRNPYLFPGLWPLSTWSQSAVQVTTTLIAAHRLRSRARIVFAGAAAVAIAGVAAAWLFGDVWPDLLVLQIQPWRALWLTAVLGAGGLALCAVELWRGGAVGRIALAALTVGWLTPDAVAALPASGLALALSYGERRMGRLSIGRPVVLAAWAVVAGLAVLAFVRTAVLGVEAAAAMPHSAYKDAFFLSLHLQAIIVVPLAVAATLIRPNRLAKVATWLGPPLGLALLIVGAVRWDRAPADAPHDLARLMASRPGAVEWIDGDTQAWTLAGRANWASELQGASIVFSRDQAMLWAQRMERLKRLGLVDPHVFEPFGEPEGHVTRPTGAALRALCRTPDGPAWIVSPVIDGEAPPAAQDTALWRPKAPGYLYGGQSRWLRVSQYTVTRCGGTPEI